MANIKQYVYFVLYSDKLCPDEITSRVGFSPTETKLRGSKRLTPTPIPNRNRWEVHSGNTRKTCIEAHIESLMAKLLPHADAIKDLTAGGEVEASLNIVRNIDPGPEDTDLLDQFNRPGLTRLRGQHPLVGFVFEKPLIHFLETTGCTVWFDEYCDEYE